MVSIEVAGEGGAGGGGDGGDGWKVETGGRPADEGHQLQTESSSYWEETNLKGGTSGTRSQLPLRQERWVSITLFHLQTPTFPSSAPLGSSTDWRSCCPAAVTTVTDLLHSQE